MEYILPNQKVLPSTRSTRKRKRVKNIFTKRGKPKKKHKLKYTEKNNISLGPT